MDKLTRIFFVIIIFIAGLILIIKGSNSLVNYANEKFKPARTLENVINDVKKKKVSDLADALILGKDYLKLEKDIGIMYPNASSNI